MTRAQRKRIPRKRIVKEFKEGTTMTGLAFKHFKSKRFDNAIEMVEQIIREALDLSHLGFRKPRKRKNREVE